MMTNEQIERAIQRRLQMTVAFDSIISQAKLAKKRVGTLGGHRHVRDHMAAIQRQTEVLNGLLDEAQHTYAETEHKEAMREKVELDTQIYG